MTDDNQLWTDDDFKRLKKRDKSALTKLYNIYSKNLYNYIKFKCSNDIHLSDEIFSETFYSAILYAPKLRNSKNIYSWLVTIAGRRFNDYLRKKYKENRYKVKDESEFDEKFYNVKDEQEKNKIKYYHMIKLSMENIKDIYSEVLRMKYFEKKSQREIAQILNKSEACIEGRVFRAKKLIKKEFKKNMKEFGKKNDSIN